MYRGVNVQLHAFLNSALGGGEWLDARPMGPMGLIGHKAQVPEPV
jgi:hypothetical protein